MFGFHKKKGSKTGEILWSQLSLGFLSLGHTALYSLPSDFFDDDYTFAFSVSFVELMRVHQFSGEGWSFKKKHEFRAAAYYEVDPSGNLARKFLVATDKKAFDSKLERTPVQQKGLDDAYCIIGVFFGLIHEHDPNPTVSAARALAHNIHGNREPFRIAHSAAIGQITIVKRIVERYGERYEPNLD